MGPRFAPAAFSVLQRVFRQDDEFVRRQEARKRLSYGCPSCGDEVSRFGWDDPGWMQPCEKYLVENEARAARESF
jgi:hypothetical protein